MRKPLFLVLAFLLILASFIVNVNAVYPYENFLADYEEYDPASKIWVEENRIGYMYESYEWMAWVRRDFGVDFFGSVVNYTFSLQVQKNDGEVFLAHLSSDDCDQEQDAENCIGVMIDHQSGAEACIYLVERCITGPVPYHWESSPYWIQKSEFPTDFHFRLFKNSLNAWLEIYSDVYFSNLLDNLTLTLQEDVSYQYMYAVWASELNAFNDGIMYNLIMRADFYKVDLNIYAEDEVYTGSLKPIVIDTSHYGVQTAWVFEGEHSLLFDADTHTFYNWTGSTNVTVANSTAETTILTVTNYGNLTLFMSISSAEGMFLWFMNRTLMWLGLIGIVICIICPVIAFDKIKHKDLESGFMWFLGVFILGIPFIVAWLWG